MVRARNYRRNLVLRVDTHTMWDGLRPEMRAYLEEQIGPIVSAAGVGWAVYHGTYVAHDFAQGFTAIYLKSGPLEVCAIGILLWLHGKWRRATSVNR